MWELIRANQRRAAFFVALMAALLFLTGYALGELMQPGAGLVGLFGAGVVWTVMTLISYFQGDRILLAASRARRIQKADHPVLWNVVEEMCIASGLSKIPEVYIIDQDAPNAFATGRNPEHAAVAVTSGLLERLDRDELQGVVAHELGHVKNRDVLYMTLVGVMLGSIIMLADIGARVLWFGGGSRRTSSDRGGGAGQAVILLIAVLLIVLAPILAQLMYLALSRRREYLADASSALFTRYPEGLARALEKISAAGVALPVANRATAPMYIVNPLRLSAKTMAGLFSTHPPTAERVRILRSLGGRLSFQGYDDAFRKVTGRPVGVVPAGARKDPAVESRATPQADPRTHQDRVRETTDAMWRAQGYRFIACPCGTALKIPPAQVGREVPCPHCGRRHS